MSDIKDSQNFDLDDIMNEFGSDVPPDAPAPKLDTVLQDLLNVDAVPENDAVEQAESTEALQTAAGSSAAETETSEAEGTGDLPAAEEETVPAEDTAQQTQDAQDVPETAPAAQDAPAEEAVTKPEQEAEPAKAKIIDFDPRLQLQQLKKKLIEGPEKRYYDLAEIGVGKLQAAVLANLVILALCIVVTTLLSLGMVPASRLRLAIFSQVLAMLGSGLLGCYLMLDGLGEIFKGRFTLNTLLAVKFLVCCADAIFALRDLRVPCCAAFTMEMTAALMAGYHRRTTEMAEMDTLRKAVRLTSIVREPDYYEGKAGILRGNGDVEDFMDTYSKTTGPETVQNIYAFIALIAALGIAALAGLRFGPGTAVQVLALSLFAAAPAGAFVALTRPMALLEKRLNMAGTVFCGWQGVKQLCRKAIFPLTESDLFPRDSTRFNGIKFYGDRDPETVLAYAASLARIAGGASAPLFAAQLASHGGTEHAVENFRDYGNGGVGGELFGEPVLLGTLNFLEELGVDVPEGTMVDQAVYFAIDGQLAAVAAVTYAKMRSSAAGMVSIFGNRRLTPLLLANDFLITPDFLHSKFSVRTRRMIVPEKQVRQALEKRTANPESDVLAMTTRSELAASAYAFSGARALRRCCIWGCAMHIFAGVVGLLIMFVLTWTGSLDLLTPSRVLLYEAAWLIPGLLITEGTRIV